MVKIIAAQTQKAALARTSGPRGFAPAIACSDGGPILPPLCFGRIVKTTLHGRKVVLQCDEGRLAAAFVV